LITLSGSEKHDLGTSGEYLVASRFERLGIKTERVDRDEDDLWCKTPKGKLFTVEVKTSSKPLIEYQRSTQYSFGIRGGKQWQSDVAVFVAFDIERIIVVSTKDLSLRVRIFPSVFTQSIEIKLLNKLLKFPPYSLEEIKCLGQSVNL
tara:strand:- start:559 stop:1002 length:444 start_codon:yes stop_codon:yes gene_type:complete